jgi:hypothetical protein
MRKNFTDIAHGLVAGTIISVVVFGPTVLGWY